MFYVTRQSSSLSSSSSSAEFAALSMVVGYLAFDHWFAGLYCKRPHGVKPLWSVTEDAVTLTFVFICLAIASSSSAGGDNGAPPFLQLQDYRGWIRTWLVYKMLRLTTELIGIKKDVLSFHQPNQTLKQLKVVSAASVVDANEQEKEAALKERTLAAAAVTSATTAQAALGVWIIHGHSYDLTDFVDRHPGGVEAIRLGQGRDCTALFESYHPFTRDHAMRILAKYEATKQHQPMKKELSLLLPPEQPQHSDFVRREKVHDTATTVTSCFADVPRDRDAFYQVLTERVAKALREKGIDPVTARAATRLRALRYLLIMVGIVATGMAHCRGRILGSFLFAIFGWFLAGIGHDAGHFAVSRQPWINNLFLWCLFLLCNPIIWQHQHTYAHHSHTNSFDHDPDLHHFHALLRVHRRIKHHSMYRYQSHWLFVMFAYAFVVFGTCIWIPWGVLREGTLYGIVEWTDRQRPLRAAATLLHLFAYTGLVVVLPFWVHSTWWRAWIAATLHVSTSGLIFAMFSQINHINQASLVVGDDDAKSNNGSSGATASSPMLSNSSSAAAAAAASSSWAITQIETSNNFCTESWLWRELSNCLNLQIEHHLFPALNHCHLHHIAPVVRATCAEYGIQYKCFASWNDVMRETLSWLSQLAQDDDDDDCDEEDDEGQQHLREQKSAIDAQGKMGVARK